MRLPDNLLGVENFTKHERTGDAVAQGSGTTSTHWVMNLHVSECDMAV
jgi:hypothetical protein